ncbi:hypothetical protein KDL29_00585 [bacterium]|nr:hypothetical protein [bacterium]
MNDDNGMRDLQVSEEVQERTTWLCDNCGTTNTDELTHCKGCAYRRDFRAEELPDIDFAALQHTIESTDESRFKRIHRYISLAKDALLLVFVIFAFVLGMRLNANWPFQTAYEQDARNLADKLLNLHVAVDMGISHEDYEAQLVSIMAEKTKFDVLYKDTNELQSMSFQKLRQAAEYFELANETWNTQLNKEATGGRTSMAVSSRNVGTETRDLWNKASSHLMLGIEDMN